MAGTLSRARSFKNEGGDRERRRKMRALLLTEQRRKQFRGGGEWWGRSGQTGSSLVQPTTHHTDEPMVFLL